MLTKRMREVPTSNMSLAERAVTLIEADRARLARAIAKQIQVTVPRYQSVDLDALAGNITTVLASVRPLVLANDSARLGRVVEDIARLRIASGFGVSEFLASALCVLPVTRRFLVMRASSISEGLEMYELIEAVVLPFMGNVASVFLDTSFDATDPESFSSERFLSMLSENGRSPFPPMHISLVEDDDADVTPAHGQRQRTLKR
jgi:hypothetical protein